MDQNVQNAGTTGLKKHKAIAGLLAGLNASEAAAAAGVHPRTLKRWRLDPEFRNAIHAGQAAAIEATTSKALSLAREALDTLADVMRDRCETGAARTSASRAVLDTTLKLLEAVRLEERLAALEGQLQEMNHANHPATEPRTANPGHHGPGIAALSRHADG